MPSAARRAFTGFATLAPLLLVACGGGSTSDGQAPGIPVEITLDGAAVSDELTWDGFSLSATPAGQALITVSMHEPGLLSSGPFRSTWSWALPPGPQHLAAQLWSGAIVIARGEVDVDVQEGAAATIVLEQTVTVEEGHAPGP